MVLLKFAKHRNSRKVFKNLLIFSFIVYIILLLFTQKHQGEISGKVLDYETSSKYVDTLQEDLVREDFKECMKKDESILKLKTHPKAPIFSLPVKVGLLHSISATTSICSLQLKKGASLFGGHVE